MKVEHGETILMITRDEIQKEFARELIKEIVNNAKDTVWLTETETMVDAILRLADLPHEAYQEIVDKIEADDK